MEFLSIPVIPVILLLSRVIAGYLYIVVLFI